ncbi:cytochrome P450 [Mycena floridula]|nr:cytochrome P450 [Mycena floridula]
MSSFMAAAIASTLSIIAILVWFKGRRKRSSLPPGPPAEPFIGHFRLFPTHDAHKAFQSWAKTYGDVMYFGSFGLKLVILSSMEVANDLLDRRSAIYSCRTQTTLLKLMEMPPSLPTLPYGKGFAKQRRLFHQYLNRQTSDLYFPIQLREARILVNGLLEHGADNYDPCLTRFATAILVRIAFGYDIKSDGDPFLAILERFTENMNNNSPGVLARFPSWFPGTYYANWARNVIRPLIQQIQEYPVKVLEQHIAEGNAQACILSEELEKTADTDLEHLEDIKGVALAMYTAGAETTKNTMEIFLLAMVLHPECQRLCQEELDRVVGTDRLPECEDRGSLPYLECVLQETLRWNPIVVLGVPHRSMEDDVYKGMFIPKGSEVIPNIYAMTHDKSRYSDPESFNPSRFMPTSEGGGGETFFPVNFGWGRRVCPGRFLAENSIWISMATILATLNITNPIGKDGKEFTPKAELTQSFIRRVKSLRFSLKPRSAKAEALCQGEKY